jgi:thioredoxin-related protein
LDKTKEIMKKLAMGLVVASMLLQVRGEELNWVTDLPKAQAQAKAENKLVMLDFTGSDWCGWCIKLHNEVFSKPEFSEYAKKNLVLVEVDFPRKKAQSEQLKKANEALQEKYKIEGYPTIIVLDESGKKVGELGYQPGGPKPFIAELDKLKKKG